MDFIGKDQFSSSDSRVELNNVELLLSLPKSVPLLRAAILSVIDTNLDKIQDFQ